MTRPTRSSWATRGQDPLFYLVIDPLMRKWSPLGNAMHAARPALLLLAMREAAAGLEGRERTLARAYVAGFACHWLLDSTVHPLVYHWQNGICDAGVEGLDERAASKVHAEIERDLDEAVLFSLTGQTVATYRPHARTLAASQEWALRPWTRCTSTLPCGSTARPSNSEDLLHGGD